MLRFAVMALSAAMLAAAPAAAGGLTASQSVEVAVLKTDEGGATVKSYAPAEEIAPGDELRYVLTFQNDGAEAASNVRLDMPVPDAVTLIDGSVEPGAADVTYSVDKGVTFAPRETLVITDEGETRAAVAEDITNIRWTFTEAIAPGEAGTISYSGLLQ